MNNENLPIDIHANKLLDWLISRRHCNKDWKISLTAIREKLTKALVDMPENEDIVKLLAGTQLNYWHCLRIVEILKETEADSKNIFGFYSSQRMKDWLEIIKMYEKDNVFLVEAAQILTRNVNYEIPSIRKQVNKLEQSQEDCRKKQIDFIKQSNMFKNDYLNACEKFNLKGENIRKEFTCLLSQLPTMLIGIVEDLSRLQESRDYYHSFLQFTLKQNYKLDECLPVTDHLLSKGNTTFYEYRTGKKPDRIDLVESPLELPDGDLRRNSEEQIDFGDGIDFVDDTSSGTTNGNGDFVHLDKADLGNESNDEVNWDITIETDDIPVDCIGDMVARGNDALTILEVKCTRNMFINELMELEGFFDQRCFELTHSDGDVLSMNEFQSAPSQIQVSNVETLQKLMSSVSVVLANLTNERIKTLFFMKDNPKYIDNLVKKIEQKLENSGNALLKSQLMEDKLLELMEEAKILHPQISLLINKTREIQKEVEKDVSKRYKGRPVNIMGGVQVL